MLPNLDQLAGARLQPISFDDAVQLALDSVLADRLAVLTGAGLSMAPPSSLPSAAAIAHEAKQRYDARHGPERAPLPAGIEEQAEFFFQRGELASIYFRSLIDQHAFAAPPNPGHYAIADLLLVKGIQTAITTNVDTMVETAGQMMNGQIETAISGEGVAQCGPDTSPLLKIHGCRAIDPDNMVWAPGQINAPPVSEYIASSARWLVPRLLDRDLVIIGYWTDWDYLNEVLSRTLGAVRPSKVIVVDLCDSNAFEGKAPELFAVGRQSPATFFHLQASGADFLDSLRKSFSRSFVRRTLRMAADDYLDTKGVGAAAASLEPPDLNNQELWFLRRDIEGCHPNQPCSLRAPPQESLFGLTILELRNKGAGSEGNLWLLDGKRIRVVRSPNKFLHRVVKAFERETPPLVAPDIVVAVGAEDAALASDIARVGQVGTIARGSSSRWLTRASAIAELGL